MSQFMSDLIGYIFVLLNRMAYAAIDRVLRLIRDFVYWCLDLIPSSWADGLWTVIYSLGSFWGNVKFFVPINFIVGCILVMWFTSVFTDLIRSVKKYNPV